MRSQSGAAVLEFALLMLVLVTLMLLGIEYARLVQQYDALTQGARAAARYASTQAPGTHTLEAKCLAITGSSGTSGSDCSGSAIVPGLTLSNVAITTGTLDASTATVGATIAGLAYTPAFTSLGVSIAFGPISAVMPQPK